MRKTLTSLSVLLAALFTPAAPTSVAQTEPMQAARVIVKYKADAVLLRKRALAVHDQHARQAQTLGERHGLALRTGAGLHERAQVVFASGMTSQQLADKLALDSEVEYAVPDGRKRATVAPNDPLYTPTAVGTQGPASGQWYLRPNVGDVKSSIDVEPAWAVTNGSASIVVAVLDSGVRFDHPDLKSVANGGNLLPGFDMISDVPVANDLNGRDTDPSDPGDWLTLTEVTTPGGPFDQCSFRAEDSSWHGTQTAGLIGALTNNGVGMAGVGRTVRVLPVRVLGKCGGFDTDIIAGMRWAAGLSVPGVPVNPNPARVINMSLGGEGVCTQAYVDAVAEINAAGVTIIASAGNSTGHAVSSPANCPGVIGVAGLRHVGTKVGFSDLGPQISISAPGGNCINITANTPCLFPVLTTSNSGLTTPVGNNAGGSIYTDSFNISIGTSFSAPLVAGTAALVLATQPALTPSELRTFLTSTVRPFPTTGGDNGDGTPVDQCFPPNPIGQAQFDQLQCYCTTGTCGAGMLDAGAAVNLAAVGVVPRVTVSPGSPRAGQALTLGGASSLVASGRSVASYQWALVSGGGIVTGFTGATDGASASVTPNAAGQFRISLTVTDSAGAQATSESVIAVQAAAVPGGGTGSSSGGGALGAGWLVLLLLAVAALRVSARRESSA
jgi:serine protease